MRQPMSVSMIVCSLLFGCKTSDSSPQDLTIIESDGSKFKDTFVEVHIFTARKPEEPKLVYRAELDQRGSFFLIDNKKTIPVEVRYEYSGKPLTGHPNPILKTSISSSDGSVIQGSHQLHLWHPIEDETGTVFNHLYVENVLVQTAPGLPAKLCDQDPSCDFTVDKSQLPYRVTIDLKQMAQPGTTIYHDRYARPKILIGGYGEVEFLHEGMENQIPERAHLPLFLLTSYNENDGEETGISESDFYDGLFPVEISGQRFTRADFNDKTKALQTLDLMIDRALSQEKQLPVRYLLWSEAQKKEVRFITSSQIVSLTKDTEPVMHDGVLLRKK